MFGVGKSTQKNQDKGGFSMKKGSVLFFPVFFAVLSFIIIPTTAHSQWAYAYGSGAEYLSSLDAITGGYLLTGSRRIGDDFMSFSDAWAVKLDQDGQVVWQKSYGGSDNDSAASARHTSDGGYIIAGTTTSFGAGNEDAWVLKLDANGNVEWQKTYGGPGLDSALFAEQILSGGYIVAGNTSSFGAGGGDAWVIKLRTDGTVDWQKTYGGPNSDHLYAFQRTGDGGYIATGGTYSFETVNRDIWVLKLDANGGVDWFRTFGDIAFDYGTAVRQTADNGFIVAGFTGSGRAAWVAKLGSNGTLEWQKRFGGEGSYRALAIEEVEDGGFIVLGEFDPDAYNEPTFPWFMKLDTDGNPSWTKKYGGAAGDRLVTFVQNSDGSFTAAGNASSFGIGWGSPWVMKVDENGSAGQCPFQGELVTTMTAATAGVSSPTLTPQNSAATMQDSAVQILLTDARRGTICPFSEDVLLKVGSKRKNNGEGTITSKDGFLRCPEKCQASYPEGFPVLLTATAGGNSTLVDWRPKTLNCMPDRPCSVFMDKKKSVKAIFDGPRKLKVKIVSKKGGTGRVSAPHGMIMCPDICEIDLPLNTDFTLTAEADDTSTFLGWSGKPCKAETSNACTVTMDKNYTVKAIFEGEP